MGNKELDQEWVELVKEALEAGISKQQIREYLQKQSQEVKAGYKVI
ncbi:anti-repressor SinI family protein [Rossellomorea vietnamensis]|uniref:Anti-repressor SinI family protein n=1 Tax=Rossellomorea vietnamensis TaxID=218284 RepID=A0ACD4C475_9BACI|nr:anti-repressor SinI family protein [Rossellomorea vietnamensis]UXH43151.1 anti-repressor SinI family protein [Rossellomorea vietnamensis]